MATPADRLAMLLKVHGDSYRTAAELSGVDHTTIMRVERGETENPATLAKIAEGYGVPVNWMRGEPDLGTDFTLAVLLRPLRDRVQFLFQREFRLSFALQFLQTYDPVRFTVDRLAQMLQIQEPGVAGLLEQNKGLLPAVKIRRLCAETGLPVSWFETGLVGREDEQELMVGLAEWVLSSLSEKVGLPVTDDEVHQSALGWV